MAMREARREALPCVSGRPGVPITRDQDRLFGKDRVTSCPLVQSVCGSMISRPTFDVLHHIETQ
jgi:hypothetical protein